MSYDMRNVDSVRAFRSVIEEIIEQFAVDPFIIGSEQIQYFEYYNSKLEKLKSFNLSDCIFKMDKHGYNDILVRNLRENLFYLDDLFSERIDAINYINENLTKIYESYIQYKYELIGRSDNNLKLNDLNDMYPVPYFDMKTTISHSIISINKYLFNLHESEFFRRELSNELFLKLNDKILFKKLILEVGDFYNLINLRPTLAGIHFKNQAAQFNFMSLMEHFLSSDNIRLWTENMCNKLGLDYVYYNQSKYRKSRVWVKFLELNNLPI